MSLTTVGIRIEVHLKPEDWAGSLRREAAAGLAATPKELSPTWLYDERGCELFEAITELAEYYPTRTERSILESCCGMVAMLTRADTLVELGAGTAEKTRLLLDAMGVDDGLRRYVPFDVAEPTLRATAERLADESSGLDVWGVVGDFRRHLAAIPTGGRRLFAFLGGTIGNLRPVERAALLAQLARIMAPGDSFLLGTDLVKDPRRLLAAYDDAAGVTAEFNRNVLTVLNRELGSDFAVERFSHVARFDGEEEWIEMRLRSEGPQVVRVPELGLTVRFADGEDLRTEISAKFRPERVRAELTAAGLHPVDHWTDPAGDFAVWLAVR